MNNARGWTVMALALLLAAPVIAQPGQGAGNAGQGGQNQGAACMLPLEPLSAQETQGLIFMREEEKLARDVYLSLYARHGLSIFDNISRSEQRHFDAVGRLIAKYGLADPVKDQAVGAFADPELAELYRQLISRGAVSAAEALKVGALIEELDIRDLNNAMAAADNADILRVYGNLSNGSRNHLRAFVSHLEVLDETYTPQYLDAVTFASILQDAGARGMMRRGNGPGGGVCLRP